MVREEGNMPVKKLLGEPVSNQVEDHDSASHQVSSAVSFFIYSSVLTILRPAMSSNPLLVYIRMPSTLERKGRSQKPLHL